MKCAHLAAGRLRRWGRGPVPAAGLLVTWFLLAGSAAGAQEMACADCHEVDPAPLESGVHAFLECADCHQGHEEYPHPEPAVFGCDTCHDSAVEAFRSSVHDSVMATEERWVDGCVACHGSGHQLVPRDDPASSIQPVAIVSTCGGCHTNPDFAERFRLGVAHPVESYLFSVHSLAVEAEEGGAHCASCHDGHAVFPSSDPRSTVSPPRIPETCGGCHGEIAEEYLASIHGQALLAGIDDSPNCTDCHGEHAIRSIHDVTSPVFAANVPAACGRCHGDVRLADKYDLPRDKVRSFEASFHGLAMRSGRATVAHCGSCHGIHDILPSSDPRSHIHPDNLAVTCGRCHPGAGRIFAIGPVHVSPDAPEHPAVYWARKLYLWLIWLVIGLMVLHNGLDLYRKGRLGMRRPAAALQSGEPLRLSRPLRFAHGLLAVSFIVLAYTGFALQYPEAWWGAPLRWGEGDLRGGLHRVAAVVLMATGVFHLLHLLVSRPARACIKQLVIPRKADLQELGARLAWSLGLRRAAPPAPWVGYPEKMEYLAVIWGTLLMSVTGLLLWFETWTLSWLPKWVTDLSTVVHFYEGVLATLAILVWHFYFVLFDPVVYPMDTAWWSGRSAPGRQAERQASKHQHKGS